MDTDFRMRARIKKLLGKITVKKNQSLLFCIIILPLILQNEFSNEFFDSDFF